jgi:neurofibromin 1
MSPQQTFKPFYESTDAIDVNLYADILVAIFRFNPIEAMENTFVTCLSNERSDAVKTCVVRAMVTLVSESRRFEAQPPIEPLYSRFSNTLRELFMVDILLLNIFQ